MTYEEALRKALACLRLAERGGTTDEAATAAAMAQQIITKYSLDVSDINFNQKCADDDDEPIQDFGYADPLDSNEKDPDHEGAWSLRLAKLVAHYNQCEIGWVGNGRGVKIRIVGRGTNVQAVRYLYAFFKRQILDLKKNNCVGHSSQYKGQFCFGCIDTLQAKLDTQHKATFEAAKSEQANNPLALVRVNGAIARINRRMQEVAAYAKGIKSHIYGTGSSRRGSIGSGHEGVEHGRREGQNIRVTGAKGSLGSGSKQLH